MSHWFFINFNWGLHKVKARLNMYRGPDETQHVKHINTSMAFIIQNKSNERIVLFHCNGLMSMLDYFKLHLLCDI